MEDERILRGDDCLPVVKSSIDLRRYDRYVGEGSSHDNGKQPSRQFDAARYTEGGSLLQLLYGKCGVLGFKLLYPTQGMAARTRCHHDGWEGQRHATDED